LAKKDKDQENRSKKANEIKKSSENKKIKKKSSHIVRNAITPELMIERKLKTEGAMHTEQDLTTYKK
jgi:hypothetical protein